MKKLIQIILVFFTFFNANAQETNKIPTRQETIDWIVKKFNTYPTGSFKYQTKDKFIISEGITKFTEFKDQKLFFNLTHFAATASNNRSDIGFQFF
jgi:hypothetical protein